MALAEAAAAAREQLGEYAIVEPAGAPGGDEATVDTAALVQAAFVARAAGLAAAHETILCAVSGDVLRPGLYELLAGAPVAAAIAAAGGVIHGLRVAQPHASLDLAAPAPPALVVRHAGRV